MAVVGAYVKAGAKRYDLATADSTKPPKKKKPKELP